MVGCDSDNISFIEVRLQTNLLFESLNFLHMWFTWMQASSLKYTVSMNEWVFNSMIGGILYIALITPNDIYHIT